MVTTSSYLFMVARFTQSLPPENHASSMNSRATARRGGAANARRPDRLTCTQPPVPTRNGTSDGARITVWPAKTWTSSLLPRP